MIPPVAARRDAQASLQSPRGATSVLLATGFPPLVGGIETLLGEISQRLSPPPLVIAPPPARATYLEVLQVPTTVRDLAGKLAYRAQWTLHPSLHYLAAFWGPALQACRRVRPEVIQCGHVYLAPLAWLLARRLRRPWLLYTYGHEVWRGGRRVGTGPLDALLRGRALRSAHAVVSLGPFTSSLLVDGWGVERERVHEIPFGPAPRPVTPPPAGTILLSVGRLVPRKGIDVVIRALPSVLEAVPSVRYRVVGSGPDEARLKTLAKQLNVERAVTFIGQVSDEALAREYAECTLFVLPARRTAHELEGLGLVYLEAAAWGRPALAGRSGGESGAVVDGVTGVLVDGTDVETVGREIVALLADREKLRTMGEAGRRRVESTHNWDRAAERIGSLLAVLARKALPA